MSAHEASENRIFDLTAHLKGDGHDVISCRKVPPSGECSLSICTSHMQHFFQFLVYSTFILV